MNQMGLQSVPEDFRCLAIETSSAVSSIAACAGTRIARAEYGSPGEQSRQVYSCVRDVLRDVSLELSDLDCIAFGAGPGGFTGLRVGAAVAQSLAFGNELRVCSISSLAVLAAGAMWRHGASTIAACVDARMGEAYLGVYRTGEGGLVAERTDRLVDPAKFTLTSATDASLFAAGGGWSAYPEMLKASASLISASDTGAFPDAADLLILAASEFAAGRTIAPHEAVPNYVRDDVTS
jgi:tRNA threonylcarbamoyladenosine biosynthesis protein TsaB